MLDPITPLPSGAAAILWGVLTFSLLVLLHEGGHFFAARAFRVKVHEFMLGLPGPSIGWRSPRSGTRYGVTIIPLGGYVRIAGMEPGAEDERLADALGLLVDRGGIDDVSLASALGVSLEKARSLLATLADYGAAAAGDEDSPDTALIQRAEGETDAGMLARVRQRVFRGQHRWKRIAILAMGVLINIIAAILILTITLSSIGIPEPVTTLAEVTGGGPAATAGIRPGDRIVAVGDLMTERWSQVTGAMRRADPGDRVRVTVRRDGRDMDVDVVLGRRDGGGALLGVVAATRNVPMPVTRALSESLKMTGQVFVAIGRLLSPSTFGSSIKDARSVVGISYEVANAAQAGALQYAWMIALLSLSLGVLNILPIPPLDGGKILIEFIEMGIGRPVPRNVALAVSAVGTLLLFSLIFYLMYADVLRYVINRG